MIKTKITIGTNDIKANDDFAFWCSTYNVHLQIAIVFSRKCDHIKCYGQFKMTNITCAHKISEHGQLDARLLNGNCTISKTNNSEKSKHTLNAYRNVAYSLKLLFVTLFCMC